MTDWGEIAREATGKNDPIKTPLFGLRHALIVSVSGTTCTITLAGVNISGVKWAIQRPIAGETVLVFQNGTDIIVVGSAGGGNGWDTYTPVLTAVTANPTLGAGAIQSGTFTQIGKTVHCRGRIMVGGAGFAKGTGNYRISMPVNAANVSVGYMYGVGAFYDSSAVIPYMCHAFADLGTGTNSYFVLYFSDNVNGYFSSGGVIAQSDEIWWNITYEAA